MTKIILSLLISLYVATITEALLLTKSYQIRHTSALRSTGSDILQRPDDEDSAEFRDYLRNLMKMQVNRARSGHAAPSSGSSDAYFAKLTRLKIEKKALRDAGLPDDSLDTSYTQDDYDSAIYEAQEPLISATVLSGDAAVASRHKKSNSKMRPLTTEEINMKENAERTVEAARERQMALPASERAIVSRDIPLDPRLKVKNFDSPEIDLIDQVLAGRSLISLKQKMVPKQAIAGYAEAKVVQQQQKAVATRPPAPAPVISPAPVARVVVPEPVVAAATVVRPAPVGSAVPLRPLPPKQAPPPPKPAAKVVAIPAPAPPAPVPAKMSTSDVELKADEKELIAKSLQMLVKHRGGGPFGAGRLQTVKEIANLEISLVNTVNMLTRVDGKAPVKQATVSAPAPAVVKETPVAVKEVKVAAPAPAPVRAVAPTPIAAAPVAAPLKARVVQSEERAQDDSAPITIAQGLDQFLLSPQLRSEEELAGLRDGLIQCLYMIQTELSSRPPVEQQTQIQMQAQAEEEAATNENEAVQRIMRINAPAMSVPEQKQGQRQSQGVGLDIAEDDVVAEIPVEQEVKLALGLLLKHRGGPGFGHGRLVGKELDLMAAKLRLVSQRLVAEALNEM